MTDVRRVHPEPAGTTTAAEAYAVARPAPAGRPWVMVTMIASIDGSAVVQGSSQALGNATDTAILAATRAVADVIVVGAATVRADRYRPPRRQGLRIGVVTASANVDATSALFTSGAGFLIMPASAPVTDLPSLRVGDERLDLAAMLTRLCELAGPVAVVAVEGGPTLNGHLARGGLVDELNLTIAPRLVAGSGQRIVTADADDHPSLDLDLDPDLDPDLDLDLDLDLSLSFDLAHVLVDDESYLFTRWLARR